MAKKDGPEYAGLHPGVMEQEVFDDGVPISGMNAMLRPHIWPWLHH